MRLAAYSRPWRTASTRAPKLTDRAGPVDTLPSRTATIARRHRRRRHVQALGTSMAATLIRDGALEIIRAIPH